MHDFLSEDALTSKMLMAFVASPAANVQGRVLGVGVWINPPENRPQVRTLEPPGNSKFISRVSHSH